MQKLLWIVLMVASVGPLAAQRYEKGLPFVLELAELWPEHESVQSLVPAVDEGNSQVMYQVTFEADWSLPTHPTQFPPNPHFSGLIGGTHHAPTSFWKSGELATPGIRNMAETGSKVPLNQEVNAEIGKGNAGFLLSGGGVGLSPNSVNYTFTINRRFPRVTLVTMIAPSPDWFVGVSGVSLFQDGAWVDSLTIPLHAYDAGTDSGPNFTSPNQPTNPAEPIFAIQETPFLNTPPLGRFIFNRIP